jgi:DUF4097 and DUF4098 domain-containing protein YvlB
MKNTHRDLVSLFFLAICLFLVGCSEDSNPVVSSDDVDNTNFVASTPFSFEVGATGNTQVRVEGINGDIVITGNSEASTVIVAGEREVGSESAQDAEDHLQYLEVSVSDLGSEILAKTTQPDDTQGRSYIVNYNITLPENMVVVANNVNGTMTVNSMESSVTAGITNGQVELNNINGSTSVNLINGQIGAEVTLPLDGTITMSVTNGNINLRIPQDTSADFSANVVNGIINTTNLDIQDVSSSDNSVSGTLSDGRGTITLSTVNGNINVTGF